MLVGAYMLGLKSCDGDPPPEKPKCEWTETTHVTYGNMQFHYPSNISAWHEGQLLNDPEVTFNGILETKGDADANTNRAFLTVGINPDGKHCTGAPSIPKFVPYSKKINGTHIEIPYTSLFRGEITVNVKSDVFNNYGSGGGSYYHVEWTSTGNDPGNMRENVRGTKMVHWNVEGTLFYMPPPMGIYRDGEFDVNNIKEVEL